MGKLKSLAIFVTLGCLLISTNILALDSVRLTGLLETEAYYHEPNEGDSESDIELATAELHIEAIRGNVLGHLSFLYEQNATDLEVDESFIRLNLSKIYIKAGHTYAPFGNFTSNMISDPLTLELGETRKTVAMLGFDDAVYGSIYAFNGASSEVGDANKINQFGLSLGFAQETDNSSFNIGINYISSIADTDSMVGYFEDENPDVLENLDSSVDGIGIHAVFNFATLNLIGEYVSALDTFKSNELEFNNVGAEPKTWNLEAGYNFQALNKDMTLAVAYQVSDGAVTLGLPKTRILASLGIGVYDDTTLAFEISNDTDYDENDGGTGTNSSKIVVQLSYEF
ncbi:MAG: LbtU family siderophore porin [Candidatus Marithrix sp.]|nr:LbtU family siderophore porin [Candidatus Marithrix sp.]